ncbi:MAG: hypothetical protein COA79_03335 [Planctomycetota bacterium]|nr:MAG: hypothetical protein COA79_03335 [Planctomycetota bacterium]
MIDNILKIGKNIDAIPSIHGRSVFAQEVRRKFLSEQYDCVAVELPLSVAPYVNQGVDRLPYISCFVYKEEKSDNNIYIPIDPGDSIIEAIRLARQEKVDLWYIDAEIDDFKIEKLLLPDEYPIHKISLNKYYNALHPLLTAQKQTDQQKSREFKMASYLADLSKKYKKILYVCGMKHLAGVKEIFEIGLATLSDEPIDSNIEKKEGTLYNVEPSTIYFLQGELPFITNLFEKSRYRTDLSEFDQTDAIKELLVTARNDFLDEEDEFEKRMLSPQRLQTALTFMRNLCILNKRFTPDLYSIIIACKATCGSYFAAQVVETAKFYGYIDPTCNLPTLKMGINQIQYDDEDGPSTAINRLPGQPVDWKPIDLKKKPKKDKKDKWKYTWNPHGQCSWPPEDDKIESFNSHVREKAMRLLSDELAKTEKFTSSIKDGIDIRETLKNWHTGDIYVKEIPPSRGKIELVIFIFDQDNDLGKYPYRVTWYAEHNAESTLSFFGTEPFDNMIGPGIAKARYGGCALIFPPKPIADIWKNFKQNSRSTMAEHLVKENLKVTKEKHVAYVASSPPNLKMKNEARKRGKHLIYIPINSFSQQEINKLRTFHVLNGHEIRSYASDFIQDD